MNPVLRNVLAVITGFMAGSMVNMLLILLGSKIVPPPAGVDVSNVESMRASIHLFTAKHFIFPFAGHAAGTFAGAWAASKFAASGRTICGFVIGVLFLAGGIAAASMIPAPTWFIALDLVGAYLPMAWLATRLTSRGSAGSALAPA